MRPARRTHRRGTRSLTRLTFQRHVPVRLADELRPALQSNSMVGIRRPPLRRHGNSLQVHPCLLRRAVGLRIERSATRLSDAFERPALDYRGSIQQSAPCGGFEPALCGLKGRHPQTNRRTGLVHVSLLQFIYLQLRLRAPGAQSGPGGARILVCGSSDRR